MQAKFNSIQNVFKTLEPEGPLRPVGIWLDSVAGTRYIVLSIQPRGAKR